MNPQRRLRVYDRGIPIGWLLRDTLWHLTLPEIARSGHLSFVFPELALEPSRLISSAVLWPTFAKRIPSKARPDYQLMLAEYGVTSDDPFEYLEKSGGKMMTDGVELRR